MYRCASLRVSKAVSIADSLSAAADWIVSVMSVEVDWVIPFQALVLTLVLDLFVTTSSLGMFVKSQINLDDSDERPTVGERKKLFCNNSGYLW